MSCSLNSKGLIQGMIQGTIIEGVIEGDARSLDYS